MTDRVAAFLALLKSKTYRELRLQNQRTVLDAAAFPHYTAAKAACFAHNLALQRPVLLEGDIFGFNRYTVNQAYLSEGDGFGNIVVDYPRMLALGIDGIEAEVDLRYKNATEKARQLYDGIKACFAACRTLVGAYRTAAKEAGNGVLYEALGTVPLKGATSYYEACVTVKFLQYILRLNRTNHVCLGRFDQYMRPYYEASLSAGESPEALLEITQLFFISLNLDTDLYEGVQQGDNGQSLVLGGVDREGKDAFSPLSECCLAASEALRIIDPKINLRVSRSTPLSLYERATRLTKQGLGFPQYCNDDVIIPALCRLGYDLADARDYAVAACWELIPSGCAADYPNLATFNFPLVLERAVKGHLAASPTFEAFKQALYGEIEAECNFFIQAANKYIYPNPLVSALVSPCIERGVDISEGGAKYNNYGAHGAGISTAADALYAIKRAVYGEDGENAEKAAPTAPAATLLAALQADFVGYEALQKQLLALPKMGNNDDRVDALALWLLDAFSTCLNGKPTARGGVWRAGTGSAMEYIFSAAKVGATPDGRRAGQPYACSFSPSLTARTDGPLSAIASFTKFDMTRACNGGPFTMELHDTVFRNGEGERKVALLVKAFVDRGGHQMQLNSVNSAVLRDAQAHPENHPNLIVRVWGWSGYFNELAREFQDHIIRRCAYT